MAKDLTIALAVHLADLVATYLSGVLDPKAVLLVLLFNGNTSVLLQASYWVRPIYEELLYASSHAYQEPEKEARRASSGLVKIISGRFDAAKDQPPQKAGACISPLTVLGKSLNASGLRIWFPAHWAVRVASQLCRLGDTPPAYVAEHVDTQVPHVRCNIKLAKERLNVEHLLPCFSTVLHGLFVGCSVSRLAEPGFLSKP